MVNKKDDLQHLKDPVDALHSLHKSDNLQETWRNLGYKQAQDLLDILDADYVVSKDSSTTDELVEMKKKLEELLTALVNSDDGNKTNRNNALGNDIYVLEQRIKHLEELGNPPAKNTISEDGTLDINTIFPAKTNSLVRDSLKIDSESIRWGGKKVNVVEKNDWREVTQWQYKIFVAIDKNGQLQIKPTKDIGKVSFNIAASYNTDKEKSIMLVRRFQFDDNTSQKTVWKLKQELDDDTTKKQVADVAKKFLRYPHQSDSKIDELLETSESYYTYAKSLVELIQQYWEEKITALANSMRSQYDDFIKKTYNTSDTNAFDQNGLGRAYYDIAKQYYFFSHTETHADQKASWYAIENPITSSSKQKEIVDRMCWWNAYVYHSETKNKDAFLYVIKWNHTQQWYEDALKLFRKDPLEWRDPSKVKDKNELSSKDTAKLGDILRTQYVDKNSTQNKQAPVSDPVAEVDSDDFKISEFEEGQEMTINASISDVSRVYEEQAEHAGEEALRKEYESLWKIKLLSPSTYHMMGRMKLYFFRERIKNKTKQAELEKTKTNGVDMHRGELTAAADRHERMFKDEEWNNQKKKKDRIQWEVIWTTHPDIDKLCREYLNSPQWMLDRDFENKFNTILASQNIAEALQSGKIEHTASNLLLKLRAERGYKTMMEWILNSLEKYAWNNDDAAYKTTVKEEVTKYVNLTQRAISPNLQKVLTAPGAQVEKYRRYLRHEIGMAKMQANTLKVKIDILSNGKWAYEVNNRDKKTNLFAWIWRRLDNNPKTALALSIWWTIATWILAGPALASTIAIAKWVTWIVSKKAAHYTKEQEWQEKKLVRGLENEKNRLNNLRAVVNNARRWQKAAIGTDTYKWVRQWQLYANTTQFEFMNDAKKDSEAITASMLSLDKPTLQNAVADALARIDYYVQSGHNFFGQQNDKEMEETMNNLQKLIVAGAETLGTTKEEMRKDATYIHVKWDLDSKYTALRSEFKTQRTILGVKYGLAAALASLWLRHVLGNDVHKHSYTGWNDGWATTVPWHTPSTPPVNHIPNQTPPSAIYDPDFDVDHHSLYDPSQSFGAYGMEPAVVLDHCNHINVLDPTLSETITKHMMENTYPNPLDPSEMLTELNPVDKNAVLSAVDKLVNSQIPPSPDLKEEVAKYLYHFAERDPLIWKIIWWWGDAVKDVINDWWSGQQWWLDAFLGGGETLARYLANIASVASPLYANTFLENPKVTPRDRTSKKTGKWWYIPTYNNTIVDPNKKPVPGWFENEDPLNWIIRKWSNTPPSADEPDVDDNKPLEPLPKAPTQDTTNWNPPTPQVDDDSQLPPTDDLENNIQQELEDAQVKKFVDDLTPAVQPLYDKYNGRLKVYKERISEFEAAKNEPDLTKKIKALEILQWQIKALKNSFQSTKTIADSKYDIFKQKYDLLPTAVQARVKDKLTDLEKFRISNEATVTELGLFVTTLAQAIAEVQSRIPLKPTIILPPEKKKAKKDNSNIIIDITPRSNPDKKEIKLLWNGDGQNKITNATDTWVDKNVSNMDTSFVFEKLKKISTPSTRLSKTKYIKTVEYCYDKYLSIVKRLEWMQRDYRFDVLDVQRRLEAWNAISEDTMNQIILDRDELNKWIDAFSDKFDLFTDETDPNVNDKDPMRDKRVEIAVRNNRLDDYDQDLEKIISHLIESNKSAAWKKTPSSTTKPLSNKTVPKIQKSGITKVIDNVAPVVEPAIVPASEPAVVSTTVVAPTVTDDSILAEFNALKWDKILRVKKKGQSELFNAYKAILEKNPDMYNYNANKKEIAISWIFDKTLWIWVNPTISKSVSQTSDQNSVSQNNNNWQNNLVRERDVMADREMEINLEWGESFEISKDNSPLFDQYKRYIEGNPDVFNYISTDNKVKVKGMLQASTNTWIWEAK